MKTRVIALLTFIAHCPSASADAPALTGKWYVDAAPNNRTHISQAIVEFNPDNTCNFESIWINKHKKYYHHQKGTCAWSQQGQQLDIRSDDFNMNIKIGAFTGEKFEDLNHREEYGEPLYFYRVTTHTLSTPPPAYLPCPTPSC